MEQIELNFQKMNGLIPVVIQDYDNGEVLMVGFMNEEAWQKTLATGRVHYFSRKKKRLWMKGEQSGHVQEVKEIYADNDADALLIKVNQKGGAVEDGYRSCFYFFKNNGGWINVGKKVFEPKEVYEKYDETIIFAIPSGSLYACTIMLFSLAGIHLKLRGERSYKPEFQHDKNLKLVVARAQEIPGMIQRGEADIGLTGMDLVQETGVDITDLCDFHYNENGIGPLAWVLAVPAENRDRYVHLKDFEGKKICTELPNITRKYFADSDVHVQIERSIGATEGKAPFLCDAIVDICESGTSLVENNLVPLYTIASSSVHLFANNESMAYGWKRRHIEEIQKKLRAGAENLPKNPKRLLRPPPG